MGIHYSDLPPKMQEQVKIKYAIEEARKRKKQADSQFLTEDKRGNKYNAQKAEVDGIVFDSKREAKRYAELRVMERSGEITDLQRQVPYVLMPKQVNEDGKTERVVIYRADFVYRRDGKTVVEDTKGMKTKEYVLKRKMMLYFHGITIHEI